MNTKIISESTLNIIDQYKNFKIGNAICSIPYFNNKTTARRAGLRVEVGKGSPKEIYDEIKQKAFEQKIDINLFTSESLKKFLVDNNIGIDCSGFAYHILDLSSKSLSFPFAKGIFGKLKAKMRPVENTDVATLAHNKNSKIVSISEIKPGDIITMINDERDHILVINQIEYQNFKPITIHYVHAIAWPTDGEYGHGIHEGRIEILNIEKLIIEQRWTENYKTGIENYTFSKAQKSQIELRRLTFL